MNKEGMTPLEEHLCDQLKTIGDRIGYGRAQQILGELWDDLLEKEYQAPRTRGKMGVTVQDSVLAELKRLQAENVALGSALDKMTTLQKITIAAFADSGDLP